MKTLWKRIPRGWRLTLDCAVLLLLLFLAWTSVDYHSLTPGAAFRRGLEDACYPPVEMELLAEARNDSFDRGDTEPKVRTQTRGLAADGDRAYCGELYTEQGWSTYNCWSFPAVAEDVWYVPLLERFDIEDFCWNYNDSEYDALMRSEPPVKSSFAVKAPGAGASLTLILDACEATERHGPLSYGSYPMILQEHRDDWFLFGFDMAAMRAAMQYNDNGRYNLSFDSSYESLLRWADDYTVWNQGYLPPAHLELTTYDEAGRILKTLQWDLRPAE